MKIIFAGTPVFAATALDALLNANHEIVLVLTQPDRPAGRGMKTVASPVKLLVQQHGLPLLQPITLQSPILREELLAFNADVMVVAAYGLILPEFVLDVTPLGCLNIHASLLPRWRGAAPIQRAILAGDEETGVTIMQMEAGLDTGPMLLKKCTAIAQDDTSQTLHDKLCILGAQAIVEGLTQLEQKKVTPIPQDNKLVCYAPKIKKTEAEINWRLPAEQIDRVVRAFNPVPGAYTFINNSMLKIWQVRVIRDHSGDDPGEIVAIGHEGIAVACGRNIILLQTIQKPGGKKVSASEYLAGHAIQPGDRFSFLNQPVTSEG